MPPSGLRPKRRRRSDTNPRLLGAAISGSAGPSKPGAESAVDGAEPSASVLTQPSHVRVLGGGAAPSGGRNAPDGELVSDGNA